MEPIHKFNNGRGAMLCNKCRTIISTGPKTEELYCDKCKPKQDKIMERFIANAKQQETLEEVTLRLYPENWESIMDGQHDSNSYERNAFIKGVKWQQERSYSEKQMDDAYDKGFKDAFEKSYSEEDIINALHSVELKDNKDYSKIYNEMNQWFKQFKKK